MVFSRGRTREGFQEDTWIFEGPGRKEEGWVNYLERLGAMAMGVERKRLTARVNSLC